MPHFRGRCRLYVVFDGFDEAEGAWVDDSDDWTWVDDPSVKEPRPAPPSECWQPNQPAGLIDKVFLHRSSPEGVPNAFFVKWKDLAHIHSQWVPRAALEQEPSNKQRVQRYIKALAAAEAAGGFVPTWEVHKEGTGETSDAATAEGAATEEEPYNPDFNIVDRIVAERPQQDDLPPLFLVKWRSLPYASATWEGCYTLLHEQQEMRRYRASEVPPTAHERRMAASGARPPRTNFKKLESSPVFRTGHELRPYQIEGVNWLLFSWYSRRSVMLADEMGLGKTIQSVSTLNHIWRNESIRGPFLVLAPLSTLAHWQREFETWTQMNAIVYHGSHESRELIRQHEWYFADGETNAATRGHYKFHALITSYEVVKTDLALLRHIPWRYMVVDEAHRLKNKDSALTADLRTLSIEHCHLLSGTPLQNNTTELWALLNFLDQGLFASLDDFLAEFGTLTDAAQIDKLNERIRPYLLRRQKGDVEKSLAPLEETIIWVEMTRFQKKCYKAVLEGNRELLLNGAETAAMPSLVNIQMELRKCCNHPYLIKGVEESETAELGESAYCDALLKASGKYVLLDKLLPKLKAEGHRVLIFSQMVKMLDMLSEFLRDRRYSHERLDGTIRGDLRQAAIDRYCRPDSQTFIFLLSTRAGGLGINLTAADTCIIMDSDWNPQNDVQAMARTHRIGQKKRVKVFRLVTRNTYESEMVERANRKLGLERAMNADRANDGLQDEAAASKKKDDGVGPPTDRKEINAMLKRGAHDIFLNEADDAAFQKFNQADINEILASSSTKVSYDETAASGSVFSKAAFIAEEGQEVDMDDPEFWTKILPEMQARDPELAEAYIKRKSKQVKRFGMVELDDRELEEELSLGAKKQKKEEDLAKRAARKALAHVWSKTERMNCERALLSFGFGRWGRIKEGAQGGTRLREESEIASFAVAFVCLCVGVPVGTIGQLAAPGAAPDAAAGETPGGEAELEGIGKARELLAQMGCRLPSLSKAQVEELEPLVSAGGAEYAERVHKLGAGFMARLLALKRLAAAVERCADPLMNFRAPPVRGGVGRDVAVPWTGRDDALLLLGLYKHGYRAYEEVRDDDELAFSCRRAGVPQLPAPLQKADLPGAPDAKGGGVMGHPLRDALFEPQDVLPLPPAWAADELPARRPVPRPPPPHGPEQEKSFLSERDFRARAVALLDALQEQERDREEQAVWEMEWEDELGGGTSRASSVTRMVEI